MPPMVGMSRQVRVLPARATNRKVPRMTDPTTPDDTTEDDQQVDPLPPAPVKPPKDEPPADPNAPYMGGG